MTEKDILRQLAGKYGRGEAAFMVRILKEDIPGFLQNSGEVSPEGEAAFERILSGEPVQYVTGKTKFFDLTISVNPSVLIPRPETEEMAEKIAADIPDGFAGKIIDLGTGSGALALAMKKFFPLAEVMGSDISPGALSTARENSLQNKLEVSWILLDMTNEPLPGKEIVFDLIVSNPPYILTSEAEELPPMVKDHEPHLALFVPGNDPLHFYKAIARFAEKNLRSGGKLWLELHENYGKGVPGVFDSGIFGDKKIIKDISGKDRFFNCKKN